MEGGQDGCGVGVGVVLGVEGVAVEAGDVLCGLVEGLGSRRRLGGVARVIAAGAVGGFGVGVIGATGLMVLSALGVGTGAEGSETGTGGGGGGVGVVGAGG